MAYKFKADKIRANKVYYLNHKDELKKKAVDRYFKNRDEVLLQKREKYRNNPNFKASKRAYALRTKYGIPNEDYDKLVEKQNNCCDICGKSRSEFEKEFFIDHDHTTKKVRGLLCLWCNTVIGFAKDNIETLKNAITYLKKHKQSEEKICQNL